MRATCGVMSARTPSKRPESGSIDLEGLQLEIAAGTRQQRIQMLDQRRLHEAVAVLAEVVEQRAPQALDPLRLGREDIVDMLGQHPATHRTAARRTAPMPTQSKTDEAKLTVGKFGEARGTRRARLAARAAAAALRVRAPARTPPGRIRGTSAPPG